MTLEFWVGMAIGLSFINLCFNVVGHYRLDTVVKALVRGLTKQPVNEEPEPAIPPAPKPPRPPAREDT